MSTECSGCGASTDSVSDEMVHSEDCIYLEREQLDKRIKELEQAAGETDYWIRQHTQARSAEIEMRHQVDAYRKVLEQALQAMQLAHRSHGLTLASNPPKQAWLFYRVGEKLLTAIDASRGVLG